MLSNNGVGLPYLLLWYDLNFPFMRAKRDLGFMMICLIVQNLKNTKTTKYVSHVINLLLHIY